MGMIHSPKECVDNLNYILAADLVSEGHTLCI